MKLINEKIKYSIISLIIPFGMYFIYKSFENVNEFSFYTYIIFFIFILINISMFFMLQKVEEITNIITYNKPKYLIIYEVLKYVLITSFLFSSYYWIIFDYKNENFINVTKGNSIEIFFDFYFYSITTFLMNNASEIKPNSILSKLLITNQILLSFSAIVLFLSNYKEVGNFFKQIEDKINKKDSIIK